MIDKKRLEELIEQGATIYEVKYNNINPVSLTNKIREKHGNTDLVGIEYDNEVYYNFYLIFDTKKKDVSIQAICNYGEKDDEVYYRLPMTEEEERNVIFQLLEILATELYRG